jgi:hypothetical protein
MWEIYKSGSVRDVELLKGSYTMSTRQTSKIFIVIALACISSFAQLYVYSSTGPWSPFKGFTPNQLSTGFGSPTGSNVIVFFTTTPFTDADITSVGLSGQITNRTAVTFDATVLRGRLMYANVLLAMSAGYKIAFCIAGVSNGMGVVTDCMLLK